MYQEIYNNYCKKLDAYLNNKQYAEAAKFLQVHKVKGYTMTASRIEVEYNVTKRQLEEAEISYIMLRNPYCKSNWNVVCYLIREVEDKLTIEGIRRNKIKEILTSINE